MAAGTRVKLNNPLLLRWARESAGYTLADIAAYMKKPESVIEQWESGSESPTYRQLETLASKFKRPLAAFFLPRVPDEPPPPADFRTLPGIEEGRFKPDSLLAFRKARNTLEETRELLESLEMDIVFSLPAFGLDSDPEKEAVSLRSRMGVTVEMQVKGCENDYQACDMWRDILFDYGVVTVIFPMQMEDARAFSMIENDLAVIGLNSKDAVSARGFSLFHEVCHLCLRRPGVSGETLQTSTSSKSDQAALERFCDRFSAGFLLPANDETLMKALNAAVEGGDTAGFDPIARRYKVSKYVILRRALDLGLIGEGPYWALVNKWKEYDGAPARTRGGADYVVNTVSHLGKRFTSLVFDALDSNYISLYSASQLLSMDPKHFRKAREHARGAVYAR